MLTNVKNNWIIIALLIVAPFSRSTCQYELPTNFPKKQLDELTQLMADFGVLVHRIHPLNIIVPVPQRYAAQRYTIPTNYDLAPYFLVSAIMLNYSLEISKESVQKTEKFLAQLGYIIIEKDNIFILTKMKKNIAKRKCIFEEIKHEFFAMVVFALAYSVSIKLTYSNKLDFENMQRLQRLKQTLLLVKIKFTDELCCLTIQSNQLSTASIDAHNDPFLTMSMMILRIKYPGYQLKNPYNFKKNYTEFLFLYKQVQFLGKNV